MKTTRAVTLTLPTSTLEKLDAAAVLARRPRSNLIAYLIESVLADLPAPPHLTPQPEPAHADRP